MDHGLIGGIINDLPIEKMVAAPVMAAVQAQKSISAGLAEYINEVGLDKDGNVRMVTFKYSENTVGDGKAVDRYIQAPFIALTGVPNFAMEEVNVTFDLEVSTAEEDKSTTSISTTSDTTAKGGGWFLPSIQTKLTASVSHNREQTRKTDTRAKYHFDVSARRQEPPEGLMRLIDAVTNAVANPSAKEPPLKDNLVENKPDTPVTPVKPS